MACTESFIAALRERGLRMTPQREMVLSALHDLADHETADEIYRRVQARSAAVDISTVYRTLDLLQDLRMLAVTEGADGQRRYTLLGLHGDHVHLVCHACGREIQVDAGPIVSLAAELHERYGFTLDLGHRSLGGVCGACAEGT